jgi:hypothetical protein
VAGLTPQKYRVIFTSAIFGKEIHFTMNSFCRIVIVAAVTLMMAYTSIAQVVTKMGVEDAMKKYNHFLETMQVDSIAGLFTENGDLGNMAHGRDSIARFLAKYSSFKVLYQRTTTDSIKLGERAANQFGKYNQRTIIPPADTVVVSGFFVASWKLIGDKWFLQRMDTHSAHP